MTERARAMIRGLIEISDGIPPGELRRLVRAAYGASRRGQLVLAVKDSLLDPVDSILDAAVAEIGLGVHGLRFFRGVEDELLDLAATTPFRVASSQVLRARLEERNLPFCTPREAIRVLEGEADARSSRSSFPGDRPVERGPRVPAKSEAP